MAARPVDPAGCISGADPRHELSNTGRDNKWCSLRSSSSWSTCGDDAHWCNFLSLKLIGDSLSKGGVYLIWSENPDATSRAAVYVGQGKPIAECLARHRREMRITRHGAGGRILRVTWARVSKEDRGGVEHYLADRLRPLEGDRWSDDLAVPVSLPW
jgi:hypothetical protein